MTGTNQGQLLTYDLPEGSVGQVPRIRTTKRDFLKSGSQAPITQLQAVPELNILLSVADAQVHVHDLETLSSMYVLEQSKGTVFFAADLMVRGLPKADTHRRSDARAKLPRDRLALQICCAMKKRLKIYNIDLQRKPSLVKVRVHIYAP